MRKGAIEPSEIIIDKEGLPRDKASHINPYLRFLARFVDYSLLLLLLLGLRSWMGSRFPLHFFEYLVPFEFFVWIPIEALLLCSLGTTPGKFFLNIKLQQGQKAKLDFFTALQRSFNVWFRGLGMGIPVLNVCCMLVANHRLKFSGKTSWDREANIVISHYPTAQWKLFFSFFFMLIVFFVYYVDKARTMHGT